MRQLTFSPLAALAALGLAATLLTGCSTTAVGNMQPEPTGSLTLAGPTFGDVSLTPTTCRSGQHEVFLGADFSSPDSKVVARLVVDPLAGPGVRIFDSEARFDRALVLKREDCASFHFALNTGAWRLNDIDVIGVTIDVDCTLPNGDKVQGKISAPSCW